MEEEIQENIRPSWIHPQHQPCYKFCPSRDVLFHLLNLFIICSWDGWLPKIVRMLPGGFYVIDIFERLSDIENLQSAEDGKVYIFSRIKIKANGDHDCRTVDGGSWVKKGRVDKNEDLGMRVQSATFYTKSKNRTNWSMDLYSIRGQELALCVIRNASAKRKVDSSNGILPGQKQRLEQPLHQEKENFHAVSLVQSVQDAFMPPFSTSTSDIYCGILASNFNFTGSAETSSDMMQQLQISRLFDTGKMKADSLNDMLTGQRPIVEEPFHQENENTHVASLDPTVHDDFMPISFQSNFGGGSESSGLTMWLPSTSLSHQEYIEGKFRSYGDGRTASLSDMVLPRYHHNILSQTDGLIEPTPETFLSTCGIHMVQLIQESPTFNRSPYYSTSTFNVSGMFEEMDNFPVSTNTFPSDMATDSKYIEETHDPRASENSPFYGLGRSASENQPL